MGRISMPQGRGSLKHNIRDYTQEEKSVHTNIDFDRTNQNIIFVHRNIKYAYEEIFGDAVREYNTKQKRNDRKIKDDDYLSKIKTSKNGEHIFYEDVLQWGTQQDFYDRETREKAKKALTKYIETFEERNPNLKLIGAYIHMDEASPHLHFDYIPVATGYKTGLPVRNSLSKAMEQMGYVVEKGASKKNNQTMLWKEHEREYFASLCEEAGLEVEPEKTWGRANLSVEEYKEAKMEMDDRILQLAEENLTMKIQEADKKAMAIVDDANTQAEEIRKQATEIKKQADVELAKSKSASVKSQEQLRWLESRIETIKHYEESSHSLMDFFKTQLDNVKETLAKVSGVILSSTTFTLIDNNVIHKTYSVNNTNPYPVTADSDEYNYVNCFQVSLGGKGEKGDTGDTGAATVILGSYDTFEELIAAHPTANEGDAFLVAGELFVWHND